MPAVCTVVCLQWVLLAFQKKGFPKTIQLDRAGYAVKELPLTITNGMATLTLPKNAYYILLVKYMCTIIK